MSIQRQTNSSGAKAENPDHMQSAMMTAELSDKSFGHDVKPATDSADHDVRQTSESADCNDHLDVEISEVMTSNEDVAESETDYPLFDRCDEVSTPTADIDNATCSEDDNLSDIENEITKSADRQYDRASDKSVTEDMNACRTINFADNADGAGNADEIDSRNRAIYTQEDLERLTQEAYLRGRNEAVEARIASDSRMRRNDKTLTTTFAPYIIGRPSVWK